MNSQSRNLALKKMHGGPDMDEFIVCLKGWKLWYSSTNNFKDTIQFQLRFEIVMNFVYIFLKLRLRLKQLFKRVLTNILNEFRPSRPRWPAKPRVSRDWNPSLTGRSRRGGCCTTRKCRQQNRLTDQRGLKGFAFSAGLC